MCNVEWKSGSVNPEKNGFYLAIEKSGSLLSVGFTDGVWNGRPDCREYEMNILFWSEVPEAPEGYEFGYCTYQKQ